MGGCQLRTQTLKAQLGAGLHGKVETRCMHNQLLCRQLGGTIGRSCGEILEAERQLRDHCLRLILNYGEVVHQLGVEHAAGRGERQYGLPEHVHELGELDAFQHNLSTRYQRIQAQLAVPFERAALLRQVGGDEVIAAVFRQGGKAVELKIER